MRANIKYEVQRYIREQENEKESLKAVVKEK
jgi:hypothetical protein